jgi:hypothetical protein
MENTMSNSSRIEAATRDRVGQTLSSEQIVAIVKMANPGETKQVYPGDSAGKKLEDGTITHRGKAQYGDIILLLIGPNQYRVLDTPEIVRMKGTGTGRSRSKGEVTIPPPNPPATAHQEAEAPKAQAKKQKAA